MDLNEVDLNNFDLFIHGPYAAWKVLRAQAPVHWNPKDDSGYWSITRYQDALSVYRNPHTFSSERGIALNYGLTDEESMAQQAGFGQMLIVTDPPRHTRMRQIVNKRFTRAALAPHEPHVRAITAEILDAVATRGECDFVVDVAAKLPTAVICEMLGIPKADWEMMFTVANMSIGTHDPEYQIAGDAYETGRQAQLNCFNYFVNVISERRKNPGNDLVSALVHGEIDGQKLTDMEILFNCFLLIIGGQETTRNATSGGMLALIENPAQRERLTRDRSLLPTAVEEVLRYTSPITHIMRTATQDIEMHGQQIKAGDRVVIWNASANRDEAQFPEPDRFDITRSPNEHVALGHGEHFCLGANLARLELRVMLDEVLNRLPDLEPGGQVQRLYSNFVAGIKHMP
ncbi:MAG TPA: cytochrome P450, partial [Candidatus Binataceae bacterium]|nr:cytochrome P450 [Candidatus Binataceae bacterium]